MVFCVFAVLSSPLESGGLGKQHVSLRPYVNAIHTPEIPLNASFSALTLIGASVNYRTEFPLLKISVGYYMTFANGFWLQAG